MPRELRDAILSEVLQPCNGRPVIRNRNVCSTPWHIAWGINCGNPNKLLIHFDIFLVCHQLNEEAKQVFIREYLTPKTSNVFWIALTPENFASLYRFTRGRTIKNVIRMVVSSERAHSHLTGKRRSNHDKTIDFLAKNNVLCRPLPSGITASVCSVDGCWRREYSCTRQRLMGVAFDRPASYA